MSVEELGINEEALGMMEILGIKQTRCEELCTAVLETASEHRDWPLGKVYKHALQEHCKNENERLFVTYIFGRQMEESSSTIMNFLRELHESRSFAHN